MRNIQDPPPYPLLYGPIQRTTINQWGTYVYSFYAAALRVRQRGIRRMKELGEWDEWRGELMHSLRHSASLLASKGIRSWTKED